jgi:hypothetical protein
MAQGGKLLPPLDDPEPCSCDESLALRARVGELMGALNAMVVELEDVRCRWGKDQSARFTAEARVRELEPRAVAAAPLASARTRNGWSSSHRGVYWHAKSARWRARVLVAGKRVSLGAYPSEDEAASAVDCALRAKGAQRG